jgi:hypothetical protein
LVSVTKHFPDTVVQLYDSDGEVLLISLSLSLSN